MPPTKIIFLDIDGVLCTRRSHLAHHGYGGMWNDWDEVGCAVIRRVCMTGVQLVISSTWRLHCAHPDDGSDLSLKLNQHDLRRFVYMPDWKTPGGGMCRGDEIRMWLEAHPDVTDYRIVDDDTDMLPNQSDHLITTHGTEGILSLNIRDLYEWVDLNRAAQTAA